MEEVEINNSVSEIMPKVAIIGRPNVGKSTLFNILTGTRKSVVKNQPGVTRDIIIHPCDVWGKDFDLIDTGGITESEDLFSQLIREQVTEFLQTVDFLILVMDGKSGLIPEDRNLIKIAKMTGKPFILVVNKVDQSHEEDMAKADFYEFGTDVIATSFEQRKGVAEILEWLHARLPKQANVARDSVTIAIVGKPNAGKSSLVNCLLGSNRMLVSDVAGTTVDAVDTPFLYNNRKYTLIDTAGLRRSSKREEDVEIIAAFKSQEAIRKADIVLLMVDSLQGPSEQDTKIMQAILDAHKGVILVANKSDLGKVEIPEFKKTFKEQIQNIFHYFEDVRVVFTSAKTGHGVEDLLHEVEEVSDKLKFRISTSDLNDFFFETIRKAPAPVFGVKNVKFFYVTQTYQRPPAFIAFCNAPDGVTPSYRRFLIKHIKEKWDLWGIPIRIFVMRSRSESKEGR